MTKYEFSSDLGDCSHISGVQFKQKTIPAQMSRDSFLFGEEFLLQELWRRNSKIGGHYDCINQENLTTITSSIMQMDPAEGYVGIAFTRSSF